MYRDAEEDDLTGPFDCYIHANLVASVQTIAAANAVARLFGEVITVTGKYKLEPAIVYAVGFNAPLINDAPF